MSELTTPEALARPEAEAAVLEKFSPAARKVLTEVPEKDWSRLRIILLESQEEGDLVGMLPELSRVMKLCPARLMGRVGRREITADEIDRAYAQLHDSIHAVRHSLRALLHLAGFRDFRSGLGRNVPGPGPIAAPVGNPRTSSSAPPELSQAAQGASLKESPLG